MGPAPKAIIADGGGPRLCGVTTSATKHHHSSNIPTGFSSVRQLFFFVRQFGPDDPRRVFVI
jgi:hypothetical protein